jgi:hypothetical protein
MSFTLATLAAGCCTAGNRVEDYRLGGSQVFHRPDGTIFALGSRSRFENEEFLQAERSGEPLPRWLEFLRIGKWEFRYPNKRMRAVVSYEVAWYTECCAGGYCELPYEVRTGPFEAWWPSGAPLARGTFTFEWQDVETNCGGTKVKRAVIGPNAEFWDEAGNRTERSILEVAGVPLEEL